MKRIIGLTGPAGSGKTTCSPFFKQIGYNIINMDEVNRELLLEERIISRIKDRFPTTMKNGQIDRVTLGNIVFHDSSEKKALEDILHPEFRSYIEHKIQDGNQYLLDMAVLFIAKCDQYCDYIIYVDADENVRRTRLNKRIQDSQKVELILASQLEFTSWKEKADVVLQNNSSYEEFECKLKSLF